MDPYDVCASCARYIKRGEFTCPFCGAADRLRSALARGGPKRASRAEWLAYGGSALGLLGCTNGSPVSAVPDAAENAASLGKNGFLCASAGNGAIFDADIVCDRASEWCYTNHGFEPSGCVSLATTCAPTEPADACSGVFAWDAATCDGHIAGCAWITVTCPGGGGGCSDDDAGGITVSCGSCYGAPPARLERVARRAATLTSSRPR